MHPWAIPSGLDANDPVAFHEDGGTLVGNLD
jgi:hypothetical protein